MRIINYHTDPSQVTKNLKTRTNIIERTYHHRKSFALEENSKKEEKKHLSSIFPAAAKRYFIL